MKKSSLIIGASGDIGLAIAKRLAEEGYLLLLHYNENQATLEQLRHEIPNQSILGILQGDLSNRAGIHAFLEKVNFPVDHVIFSSGKSHYGLFQDTGEDVMDEMYHLHIKAPWMISNHLLPDMIKNKSGNIVFISSVWGNVGASCEVVYSSVKGAQNSFVKALGKELAQSGVSVNAVSPGFIDTKMNHSFSLEEKQALVDQIPINRPGYPDEIAHVVSFLLDERTSYMHGEIINVTGGW